MPQLNDLSTALAALDENSTLIAMIEMSQSSWLVAAIIHGVERQGVKKLIPDAGGLLRLLHRCAAKRGRPGTIPTAPVPLPAPNDCCGFGEGAFAMTNGNGQDAPIAAIRTTVW